MRRQFQRVPVIGKARRAVERAEAERDRALAAEEVMRAERNAAYEERDRALDERDKVLRQIEVPYELLERAEEPRVRVRISHEGDLKSKRTLVVPVQGPVANRELQVTQPFFEAYCRRVDIDLQIIDVPQSLPSACVKASLRPLVGEYDRFAIAEPHIIIRDGCPDLFAMVPEKRLGAMIDGRWTDRRQRCVELSGLCGFQTPLPTERYINTDLLVMSSAHLPMLEALMQMPISTYQLGTQDAFNALLYHTDLAVYGLPRDFNWIPCSSPEFDWRWAWIFNMADSWRSPPTQDYAWKQGTNGLRGYYSRTPLAPQHCRLPTLIEITEQLRGSTVRLVNAAEMSYQALSARIHLTADEAAVMSWRKSAVGKSPPIYGPYLDLPAGRWSVTLLAPDGVTPADPEIVVDMVHDSGRNTVRPPAPVGSGATFEILLDRNVTGTEVRMYSGDRDHTIGCILFRALTDSLRAGAVASAAWEISTHLHKC